MSSELPIQSADTREARPAESAAGTESLPWVTLWSICGLVVAIVLGVRSMGWLEPFELAFYDQGLRWRTGTVTRESEVVVIGFEDEALTRWSWPVPDAVLNTVIEQAFEAGADVVGVDIYRDTGVAPGSEDLNRTFRDNDSVVGVMKYPSDQSAGVPAPAPLRDSHQNRIGFTDMVLDQDGLVRRGLLYLSGKGNAETSLALQTARLKLKRSNIRPQAASSDDPSLKLGAAVIQPLDAGVGGFHRIDAAGYQFLLDYRRAPSEIDFLSAEDVYDGRVDAARLKGKIALIGVASEQVKDHFILPLPGREGRRTTFGVVLHALVADQILRLAQGSSRPTYAVPGWLEIALVLGVVMLVGVSVMRLLRPATFILFGAGSAVLALIGGHLALLGDVWLPAVPIAIAAALTAFSALAWRAFLDRRERVALARLLTNQVSSQLAQELWQNRRAILRGTKPRSTKLTATVLFVDIAGSTTTADELAPDDLMHWVGAFLEEMAEAVVQHNGVIEKFTGDGLMAVFGIPVPRTGRHEQALDAVRAVECALQMGARVDSLNERLDANIYPPLRCRIGINTGELSAGSVGTQARMQYTVIGQSANLAARLEAYGKDDPRVARDRDGRELSCRILLSGKTVELLPDVYNIEPMGELELRGTNEPTTVYRLMNGQRSEE